MTASSSGESTANLTSGASIDDRRGFTESVTLGLFLLARSRELLGAMPRVVEPEEEQTATPDEPRVQPCTCPRCGARMIIIEVFARGCEPRYRPTPAPTSMRID
jgi:hypothetical protein